MLEVERRYQATRQAQRRRLAMGGERLTRQERRRLARVAAKARNRQPYMRGLATIGATQPRGSLVIVDVGHDDWCPRLRGGLCRCDPDIVVRDVRASGDDRIDR